MAKPTNEELTQQVSDLQTSNDVLQKENAKQAQKLTQLATEKKVIEDDLQETKDELANALKRNQELADDLEDAQTQVPVVKSKDSDERVPGIYLKDKILFIPTFGHVRKEDGPLTEKQLKALIGSFDSENWSEKQIAEKFLEVVEG